jgi:hypothetical protein
MLIFSLTLRFGICIWPMGKPCSEWLLPFMETLNLVQTGFKSESSFYVNFSNVFLYIFFLIVIKILTINMLKN